MNSFINKEMWTKQGETNMGNKKNIIHFINPQDIEQLILNYIDEKAGLIKATDPYNFVRLNDIRCELKRIFSKNG